MTEEISGLRNSGRGSDRVSWLAEVVGRILEIEPGRLPTNRALWELGLDSLGASRLISKIRARVSHPVSVGLVWEHPTIEGLARALSEPSRGTPTPLQPTRSPEPIAVVGIGCRAPGGADSADALWTLLARGVDATSPRPPGRWSRDVPLDPSNGMPGSIPTDRAGFLTEIDRFDPGFFGISPREAVEMDPQQRLFLQQSWSALLDAGMDPLALSGSNTGVFVGAIQNDYAVLQHHRGLEEVTQHTATGSHLSIIANRVSYWLGLRGPSLVVDTACSSSLVAVHLACASLRDGECDVAVVGGVHLLTAPFSTVALARFGGLAPDGRCRAFDGRASGFGRGEGCGVVVLVRHSVAIRNGDRIYCTIRGSAVNNDGASNGLTAPNPAAQRDVITQAWARAGIEPRSADHVEAHGTGTVLGDPIEAESLGAVFGPGRTEDHPLSLSSIKTNIGHLEGAAGIFGLIKTALSLFHRARPPSLHFETPNPRIDFDALRLRVVTELEEWPRRGGPRTAGVSSFGFGGTNCHLVLEEDPIERPWVFARGASSREELVAIARTAASALSLVDEPRWRRDHDELCEPRGTDAFRLVKVADSRASLHEMLADGAEESVCAMPAHPPRLAFVFPGQGTQWEGMGRALFRTEPVFRDAIEECDAIVRSHCDWSLIDRILQPGGSWLERVDVIQPVLLCYQLALAMLLGARGIRPDAVIGQSMGEIAAARVAGTLTVEDAVGIICLQSRASLQLAGDGAMAIVPRAACDVETMLRTLGLDQDQAVAASDNGPSETVVSGTRSAVDALVAAVAAEDGGAQRISVDFAAHGPQIGRIAEPLRQALSFVAPRRGHTSIMSTVDLTSRVRDDLGADYWVRNLGERVRFREGIERLLAAGTDVFIELSPHPTLLRNVAASAGATSRPSVQILASSRRQAELDAFARCAAAAYAVGIRREAGQRDEPRRPYLLPISGRTRASLSRRIEAVRTELQAGRSALEDLTYSAQERHPHLEWRACAVGRDQASIVEALTDATTDDRPAVPRASRRASRRAEGSSTRVALVFSGQGGQWPGMGAALYREFPVFAAAFDRCREHLSALGTASSMSLLDAGEPDTMPPDRLQPQLFALAWATSELLRHVGVRPAAVLGHSQGEIVAAVVAGALSLAVGAEIVQQRSRIIAREARRNSGGMMLVECSVEQLPELEPPVWIAAHNGPRTTVLTGDREHLGRLREQLERMGHFARMIDVDYSSHCPRMDVLVEPLRRALAFVRPTKADIPLFSTVDAGKRQQGTELDASYWVRNLREPVRFHHAVRAALAYGCREFLEVSPHPTLVTSMVDTLAEEADVFPTMRRGAEVESLLETVAALYCRGLTPRWRNIRSRPGRFVPLPSTGWWEEERIWLAPGSAVTREVARRPRLELRRVDEQDGPVWELRGTAWLYAHATSHRIRDRPTVSGARQLALMWRVGELEVGSVDTLEDVVFASPLEPGDSRTRVQVALVSPGGEHTRLVLRSRAPRAEHWTTHASATVGQRAASTWRTAVEDTVELRRPDRVSSADFYRAMARKGVEYGPELRLVRGGAHGRSVMSAEIEVPSGTNGEDDAALDPDVIDACLQPALYLCDGDTRVLASMRRISMRRSLAIVLRTTARLHQTPSGARAEADVTVRDDQGAVVLQADGIVLQAAGEPIDAASERGGGFEITWEPEHGEAMADGVASERESLIVVGDADCGLASELAKSCTMALGSDVQFVVTNRCADGVFEDLALQEASDLHVLWAANIDASPSENDAEGVLRRGVESMLAIMHRLGRQQDSMRIRATVVTRGACRIVAGDRARPEEAMLWGAARVARSELGHARIGCVDLPLDAGRTDLDALAALLGRPQAVEEAAIRAGRCFVPRLEPSPLRAAPQGRLLLPSAPFRVVRGGRGIQDLVATPLRPRALGRGDVEIEVEASGLNFFDVLAGLGEVDAGVGLGVECAGRVVAVGLEVHGIRVGDAVVALADDAVASRVVTSHELVVSRPSGLDPVLAVAANVSHLTAYHAVCGLANATRGERLLVHVGSGAVGQAVIQWAHARGCVVYATAGTFEKRRFLERLGVARAMDSRSISFVDEVREATAGDGVDIVVNSLTGELRRASLGLLRPHGRFVELGKRVDADGPSLFELALERRNLSIFVVDLRAMFREQPRRVARLLAEVWRALESARVTPPSVVVFDVGAVRHAVGLMARAGHIGKCVVDFRHAAAPTETGPGTAGRRDDVCAVVSGGLGGLGRIVCRHLLSSGVRRVALLSRSASDVSHHPALAELRRLGLEPFPYRCDVACRDDVERVLADIRQTVGRIASVYHLAATLDDQLLGNLDADRAWRVVAPKALGAWNLHDATLADRVSQFVCYSSISAVLGLPGQAAYAAANAAVDALMERRRADGLPGLALAWGPVGEVGLAASSAVRGERLGGRGLHALSPSRVEELLADLEGRGGHIVVADLDPAGWVDFLPGRRAPSLLRHLISQEQADEPIMRSFERLTGAARRAAVEACVREQLGRVLRRDPERIEDELLFNEMGLDSLMGLELRNRLERTFGVRLPASAVWAYPTVRRLAATLLHELGAEPSASAESRPLEALSMAELLQRLNEKVAHDG